MSLQDHLLEDDGTLCECGEWAMEGREVCAGCLADLADLYADEAISERGTR